MKNRFEIPILLIVYNKPNEVEKVLSAILKTNPKSLYIASDKWQNDTEKENVLQVRRIISDKIKNVECKVRYNDTNLGCKNGVVSAIDWLFQNEEYGIILEEDCLPNSSFFEFCKNLLIKYKDDKKIFMISGSNPTSANTTLKSDYYFSKYIRIWGWATWKRCWEQHDPRIQDWPKIKSNKSHYSFFDSVKEAKYWEALWDKCYSNTIDTWDYQLYLSQLLNNGISIVTTKNLVSNIGFGNNATHTKVDVYNISNYPTVTQSFPLKHPESISVNAIEDIKFSNLLFSSKFILIINIFSNWFKKLKSV